MRPHALLSSFLAPVTVMLSPSARNWTSSPAKGLRLAKGEWKVAILSISIVSWMMRGMMRLRMRRRLWRGGGGPPR